MSILSTIKRGYLYLKTTSGYIKVLPRTEASLVELKDGTNVENRISNKAAYSYIKEVTTEEYHSQAGKEYNWESSSFTSAGGKCYVNVYGAIGVDCSSTGNDNTNKEQGFLSVYIDDKVVVQASTISRSATPVFAATIVNLDAGKHNISLRFGGSATYPVMLATKHKFGMNVIEI